MKYTSIFVLVVICLSIVFTGCLYEIGTTPSATFSVKMQADETPMTGHSLETVGYSLSVPEDIGILDPNPIEFKKPNLSVQTFDNHTWEKVDIPGEYTFVCLNISYWGISSDEVELMYLQAFRNDALQDDTSKFLVHGHSLTKSEAASYLVFEDETITVYDWLPCIYPNGMSDVVDTYVETLKGTDGEAFDCTWFSYVQSYLQRNLQNILVKESSSEFVKLESSSSAQENLNEEPGEPSASGAESHPETSAVSVPEPEESSSAPPEKVAAPETTEEKPRAGLGRKLTLTVQTDEPADVARAAMEALLSDLTAPDLPDNTRILSYEIADVQVLAGDISEFAAAIEFTAAVEPGLAKSHGLININLPDAEGNFACGWQLRIQKTEKNTFSIVQTGSLVDTKGL